VAVAEHDTGHATAAALLERSEFFSKCRPEDLAVLARDSRFHEYAPGADIVREGDVAAEVFIIEYGRAAVLKHGAGDAYHEIAQLVTGASFGEMALLDPGERSATVRALEPMRILVIPCERIIALAEERPTFVPALIGVARLVAARLRKTNDVTVQSLDRALGEERTRVAMGKFTFLLIIAYSLYTWVLGTASQVKEALGRSELVTVPVIAVTAGILVAFMKTSGYPASFFGITLRNAGRHVLEAILFTLPLFAVAVILKVLLVRMVPAMHGQPIFQMFSDTGTFNPWLALAYVIFVPFQELIYRGGVQGALEHFLTGRWRSWMAIAGSNVIFSAGHLYISVGLSVTAFVAGLFWGWLYSRQRGLAGVSVSHVLLGFFAFEVVGMGVLA
jgi:CRP-like cAMP-binding protein